jgi:hypothetical protein
MGARHSIIRLFKSVHELGFIKSAYFAIYQMAKKSGFFRYIQYLTPNLPKSFQDPDWIQSIFASREMMIKSLSDEQIQAIIQKADFVGTGWFHAFEGYSQSIDFSSHAAMLHWSKFSDNFKNGDDIKLHWEAARFSWVFPLIQATILTQDPKYFQTFKKFFQQFNHYHPQNLGIHWTSSQEVAIRLIALICAYGIFSTVTGWDSTIAGELRTSIWQHACRIPSTLIYARAQNNNHLLSEALGLFYAGTFFKQSKKGKVFCKQGWKLFNHTIQSQIRSDGTYIQHSMNYHRLILSEAIWFTKLAELTHTPLPEKTLEKLQAATRWLQQFVQPENGRTPNLGHNDGSLIFPLSTAPYDDYRPILDACRVCFLSHPLLPTMEIAQWLSLSNGKVLKHLNGTEKSVSLPILRNQTLSAYLRAETYSDRPAHADQNHLDLWFHGENVALDAGTYRYTDLPPWDNGLAHTQNHNTITINDLDQMTWAGRFLWLDWSKGTYLEHSAEPYSLTAQHDGYKKIGVQHQRRVTFDGSSNCLVEDTIYAIRTGPTMARCALHWLLPDGDWSLNHSQLKLHSKGICIQLDLLRRKLNQMIPVPFSVLRCGQLLHGCVHRAYPTLGWVSPTYNVKIPAISILAEFENPELPFSIQSHWTLTKTELP